MAAAVLLFPAALYHVIISPSPTVGVSPPVDSIDAAHFLFPLVIVVVHLVIYVILPVPDAVRGLFPLEVPVNA